MDWLSTVDHDEEKGIPPFYNHTDQYWTRLDESVFISDSKADLKDVSEDSDSLSYFIAAEIEDKENLYIYPEQDNESVFILVLSKKKEVRQ